MNLNSYENAIWLGPVNEESLQHAEEYLGVPFPKEYREFVLRYGSGFVESYEIYGLGSSKEKAPNILWLIEEFRKMGFHRPVQLLPFHAEGDGVYSVVLAAPFNGYKTGSIVYWYPRHDDFIDVKAASTNLKEWFSLRLSVS